MNPTDNLPATPQGLQDELLGLAKLRANCWTCLKETAQKLRLNETHAGWAILDEDRAFCRWQRQVLSADFEHYARFLKFYRARYRALEAALRSYRECAA